MADLGKFRGVGGGRGDDSARPIDPEAIFRRAPKGAHSFADLWRGQTDALRAWTARRKRPDVLVQLNTGAGKTVVGLLIAQSFVNEGLEHVVYVCGTIDLVHQTAAEARRLGLEPTLRIHRKFSDPNFETGKSFCITTYSALYQPYSKFRDALRPQAIIFDDAHTSEGYLRDSFTLKIDRKKHSAIFSELTELYKPAFKEISRLETLNDVLSGQSRLCLMVPPLFANQKAEQVRAILKPLKAAREGEFVFRYGMVGEQLEHCAVVVANNVIEFAPPFLPIRTIPYFEGTDIRRVYLSATINYKSDLIRCCGREIDKEDIIAPKNDAGEGERLILFSKLAKDGAVAAAASRLADKHKLVIAVPSYPAAKRWESLAQPPELESFTEELAAFRKRKKGAFILVYRLDGIDLPDDTCRLMVIDGLPAGSAQLERFQWQVLGMRNVYAAKLASRITQIFGRINRGTRDYSIHLIDGPNLNTWLMNDRHLALLSPLLRSQILLGQELQTQVGIQNPEDICSTVEQVLRRDEKWTQIYRAEIQDKDLDPAERQRAQDIEEKMIEAAKAEVRFGELIWQGDVNGARRALEDAVANVARGDGRLAGWFNVWIGYCFDLVGETASARDEYQRARQRISMQAPLPRGQIDGGAKGPGYALDTAFQSKMETVLMGSPDSFNRHLRDFARAKEPLGRQGASAFELEEAVRSLGEMMGYQATRPHNDEEGGPDVAWHDVADHKLFGFELKTDKKDDAVYNVGEVGRALNYAQWLEQHHKGDQYLGLIFVGPRCSMSKKAAPTADMYLVDRSAISALANDFERFLTQARNLAPGERAAFIKRMEGERFGLPAVFRSLAVFQMKTLERA